MVFSRISMIRTHFSLSPSLCLAVALFSWAAKHGSLFAHALSAAATTATATATVSPKLLSPADLAKIANGGAAVVPNFVPPDLVARLRSDARRLHGQGAFRPDGLSNYAKGNSDQQGFTPASDRQTFRGAGDGSQQSWHEADLGDYDTRREFDALLGGLRRQLADSLGRPTLLATRRDEITYNWYEPGARLGRHLDEHHEETKGPKGWRYPSRRSVTWLVYLNDGWRETEGGALRCHPRGGRDGAGVPGGITGPVGAHEGNLQVGWLDGRMPVYLDAFRDSGGTALYSCGDAGRAYLSARDFDVPPQPIDFRAFLPAGVRPRFEQISTASRDPRFVATGHAAPAAPAPAPRDSAALEVTPSGGTLVLFDSVTMPHSVLEVTGDRPRIATTGWFHEDSQFSLGEVA